MTTHDTAFQFAAANIRFGSGITGEVGDDLNDLGARRTMVVIDPAVRDSSTGETVLASLKAARVDFEVYDQVVVEPTDASFQAATAAARAGKFDSFVAVGGGSTIDTAKAANLYSTHAAAFFDFVNAPIGRGLPALCTAGFSLFRRAKSAFSVYASISGNHAAAWTWDRPRCVWRDCTRGLNSSAARWKTSAT